MKVYPCNIHVHPCNINVRPYNINVHQCNIIVHQCNIDLHQCYSAFEKQTFFTLSLPVFPSRSLNSKWDSSSGIAFSSGNSGDSSRNLRKKLSHIPVLQNHHSRAASGNSRPPSSSRIPGWDFFQDCRRKIIEKLKEIKILYIL